MTNAKLTKKDYFTTLANFFEENQVRLSTAKGEISSEEIKGFLQHEVTLLSRKNTNSTKMTAKQKENEDIKALILEELARGVPMTITELQKANPVLGEYQNQKLSAVARIMRETDKTIIRTIDKRKSYFSLAK